MRIPVRVREGVVLSMDSYPFLRGQSGRDPQRESEHPGDRWMKRQGTMRGAAMQVDCRAERGHLRENNGDGNAADQC